MEEKGQKDGIKRAEERHSDRENERGGADCQPSASSLSQPAGMQIWSQTRHTDRHTHRPRRGGGGVVGKQMVCGKNHKYLCHHITKKLSLHKESSSYQFAGAEDCKYNEK